MTSTIAIEPYPKTKYYISMSHAIEVVAIL